jgi:hypothetical protein
MIERMRSILIFAFVFVAGALFLGEKPGVQGAAAGYGAIAYSPSSGVLMAGPGTQAGRWHGAAPCVNAALGRADAAFAWMCAVKHPSADAQRCPVNVWTARAT